MNAEPVPDQQLESQNLILNQLAAVSHSIPNLVELSEYLLHGFLAAQRVRKVYPVRIKDADEFAEVGVCQRVFGTDGHGSLALFLFLLGSTPEALVKGRENVYFSYFWNDLAADKNKSIPKSDRKACLAAYSRTGRMRAAWGYFVSWQQAAQDFAEISRTKLTMPVLSIGGDKSLGEALGAQMKLVANDVKVVIVKNSGHWILEEQSKQTVTAIQNFL